MVFHILGHLTRRNWGASSLFEVAAAVMSLSQLSLQGLQSGSTYVIHGPVHSLESDKKFLPLGKSGNAGLTIKEVLAPPTPTDS